MNMPRRGSGIVGWRVVSALLVCSSGCSEPVTVGKVDELPDRAAPASMPLIDLDRFVVQTRARAVDVLWVLDDSCSMQKEQPAIATNARWFMQYVLDLDIDFHIGIVTTDMLDPRRSGRLVGEVIDREASRPLQMFQAMAFVGTRGNGDESGRAAAYSALELLRGTDNAGFLRDDADLAIIIISDAEDYSLDEPISQADWIAWLARAKPNLGQLSFSAIVSTDACTDPIERGYKYMEVAQQIGGVVWPICDTRWDLAFKQIGFRVAGLEREYSLSQYPVDETIVVRVRSGTTAVDLQRDVDWSYLESENRVRLEAFVPAPGAEITVQYERSTGCACVAPRRTSAAFSFVLLGIVAVLRRASGWARRRARAARMFA